jgi:3'-5' exoribonuclease
MKIKEIEKGRNEIRCIIKDIVEKEAHTGNKYIDILAGDGEKETWIKGFGITKETFRPKIGDIVDFILETTSYNGALSSKLVSCTVVELVDKSEFIESPPIPTNVLFEECLEAIEEIENIGLKTLVKTIYEDNKDKLLYWGAAKSVHHNIMGGLLWHQYRMMKQAQLLCSSPVYPSLNKDLVVAGCLLHDIGKLKELSTDEFGVSQYTVDGTLFGHLLLGIEMVKEYAKELSTEEEIVRDICHIIASHHGQKEWGAIATPATIEAYFVSEIDMVDSRAYVYEKEENDLEPGTMTDRGTAVSGIIYRSANKY